MPVRMDRGHQASQPHFNYDQLQALRAEQEYLEETIASLKLEVAQLETRASNLRHFLASEQSQASRTQVQLVGKDVVPLRDAERSDTLALLAELQRQEHELKHQAAELTAQRRELEVFAAQLHDEKTILAEQAAALMVARSGRFENEAAILAELEALAQQLVQREQEQANADAVRLERAQALWVLQNQMEAQRSQLKLEQESLEQRITEFERRSAAMLQDLADREAALTRIATDWANVRRAELRRQHEEQERWAAQSAQHRLAQADLEELQASILRDASAIAAEAHAIDQLKLDLPKQAVNKIDQLKNQWMDRLGAVRHQLDDRRSQLDQLMVAVEDELRKLNQQQQDAKEADALVLERIVTEPLERERRIAALSSRLGEIEAALTAGANAQAKAERLEAELKRLANHLACLPPPTLHEAPLGESLVALLPVVAE